MPTSIAVSFLILALVLALTIALRPGIKPDKPGLIAIVAGLVGAIASGSEPWTELPLAFLLPVLAGLLLIPAVAIARGFGRIDMLAILFHQDFGIEGASLRGIRNEIATAVAAVAVILLALPPLDLVLGRPFLFLPGAALALMGVNPVLRIGLGRLLARPMRVDLTGRLVDPGPALTPPASEDLPDILIVYLEGTDRRFADPVAYGDAYRKLSNFAAAGLSLTRVGQIVGTGWSVAGMAASQGGVPVLARGFQFKTGANKLSRFMPEQRFLGDILADLGYARHFLVGNEADFAGTGAMYRSHGVSEITSGKEMGDMFPPEDYAAAQVSWFMDDQMVLDATRQVHARLAGGEKPIALFVETIGPHGPKGCLSRRWTESGKAEETRDMAHAVSCLIDEVLELVEHLRAFETRRGRPLRVVLLSDHLNHTPGLPVAGTAFEGFNTAILWGDPAYSGRVIDRPASMIDLFPTILDWLGWAPAPVAAGLGRSVLSDTPTLVEEFGLPALDAMLVADAGLARRLWAESAPDPVHRA